jgi:type I restriction enzyme S subunit
MKAEEMRAGYAGMTQLENGAAVPFDKVTEPKVDQGGPLAAGEFTYVDISSVDNKLKRITEYKTLAVETAPSRAKQRLKSGDVLVSMTRPNLNAVAIVPPELDGAVGSTGFHVLRATEGTEPRWLYYAVQTKNFISSMSEHVQGALYPAVRPKDIRAYEIMHPPLDQQKRIVAEIEKQFSRLDEAVADLKRVKANLKRYKAAVLKAAVEGRLVETEAELARREGRSYETGAQLLQRILETRRSQWQGKGKYKEPAVPDTAELPELPEGWVWSTMPQLGELNRGKSKHRPRDDERLYGGPYPFIQTGDVRKSGGSIKTHSQTYSEFGLQQSRLWPAGTLCITIAANIAETGVLKFAACFPDSVVGFLMEANEITTRYVEYFIRTAREKLERFAPATAQKNINLEVLETVCVPLPPMPEQHRIVAEVDRCLSVLRETEAQVDANLQRAERMRQSLLANVFSGRM